MVVCGLCAVFTPLAIQRDSLTKEFPFSIFCGVLLLALGYAGMAVGRLDGLVLLALFAVYMIIMVRTALKARAGNAAMGRGGSRYGARYSSPAVVGMHSVHRRRPGGH